MDYSEPVGTTITFQPGDTRTCISIPIVDDQIPEPMECFLVNAQPRPDERSLISITNTTTVCIEDKGKVLVSESVIVIFIHWYHSCSYLHVAIQFMNIVHLENIVVAAMKSNLMRKHAPL